MSTENIDALWDWFTTHEQKIKDAIDKGSDFDREYIVENLNNLILAMGMLSWEIGPGKETAWSLTISPNGDRKRMLTTRQIIESAPPMADWEFHYCKPAKDWDRSFQLYDDFMAEHSIDASDWHFVVSLQEGLIHILLEAPDTARLDPYTAQTAAELVVINEIGEETKILHVGAVELAPTFTDELAASKAGIAYLKRWVEELVSMKG